MENLTPTMDWARRHGHTVHPVLKKAIDEALPLVDRGLAALAIAQAFDAGVLAERSGIFDEGKTR